MNTKPLFRAGLAALALTTVAACGEITGGPRIPVAFQTYATSNPPAFSVAPSVPGALDFTGAFQYSSCATGQRATASVSGSTLTFRVTVQNSTGVCPAAALGYTNGYQARIGGLKAKTYHVRIEHYGTTDTSDGITPLGDGIRYEQDVTVY